MTTIQRLRPSDSPATAAPAPARPYAGWSTDQLTAGLDALATWVLDRSATGPVDPSTFEVIQAMATERASR